MKRPASPRGPINVDSRPPDLAAHSHWPSTRLEPHCLQPQHVRRGAGSDFMLPFI
jgi:hypothetical protein